MVLFHGMKWMERLHTRMNKHETCMFLCPAMHDMGNVLVENESSRARAGPWPGMQLHQLYAPLVLLFA